MIVGTQDAGSWQTTTRGPRWAWLGSHTHTHRRGATANFLAVDDERREVIVHGAV